MRRSEFSVQAGYVSWVCCARCMVDPNQRRMLLAGSDGIGHRSAEVGGHQ